MLKLVEMDEKVTLFSQMEENGGPVILINKFNVDQSEVDQLLKAWAEAAEIMKRQPGAISTQLYGGIGGSSVFVNYAIWESVEAFKKAFTHPEFQEAMKKFPPSAVSSPHLFKKVAVPGICVG